MTLFIAKLRIAYMKLFIAELVDMKPFITKLGIADMKLRRNGCARVAA